MSIRFSLSKWYMDVVSEEGEAVIVYAAELQLGALHVHYASVLHSRGLRIHSTASLRNARPVLEDETVTWSSRGLGAQGTWRAEGARVAETLFSEEGGGSVEWNCVMPLARAEVTLDGGRVVRGLGYVEQLRLGVTPWSLPIQELRWGRFTGDGTSVVWIDWRGPHTKKVIARNGARVEGAVGDNIIDIVDDDAHLKIETGRVLREGKLGTNALAALAELHPVLPGRLLAVTERKIVAPATLEQPFTPPVKGWVISEVVTWPP